MFNRKRAGLFLILVGVILVIAAVMLVMKNLNDNRVAETSSEDVLEKIEQSRPDPSTTDDGNGLLPDDLVGQVIPDYILNPEMDMPTVEINGYLYIGTIAFPALDLELPVMDTWSYPQLNIAPCRYSGTAYMDNFVIAAHNYVAHFGRINRLEIGDSVIFTDMDGNVFRYTVAETDVLSPYAVEEMTSSGYDLTLFTCTLSGQTRFTLRCNREK